MCKVDIRNVYDHVNQDLFVLNSYNGEHVLVLSVGELNACSFFIKFLGSQHLEPRIPLSICLVIEVLSYFFLRTTGNSY